MKETFVHTVTVGCIQRYLMCDVVRTGSFVSENAKSVIITVAQQ